MQTTLLDIQVTEERKNGKKWNVYEVSHKMPDGKKGEKKLLSFSMDEGVRDFLDEVDLPKMVEISTEKNDKGFWEWTGIKEISEFDPPKERGSWGKGGGGQKKGDWETAEERAFKQRCIVAQSSIGYAIEFCKMNQSLEVPQDTVFQLADQYYDFVMKKAGSVAAPTEEQKTTKVVRRGAKAKMPEDIENDPVE